MGGWGSGRRRDLLPRMTVEHCVTIEAHALARQGIHLEERERWLGRRFETIYIVVEPFVVELGTLRVTIDWGGSGNVQYIHFTTTEPRFGGIRWWFMCPTCDRRCAKLHLPPRAGEFRCRCCHSLTYKSCQESHVNMDPVAIAASVRRWRERLMKCMRIM